MRKNKYCYGKNIIISIDFDGVIAKPNKWPLIGSMMPYAKKVINMLHRNDVIIINTCRCGIPLADMEKYLNRNRICYDWINTNVPEKIEYFGSDSRKINADVYIDDHNFGGFPGWKSIEKELILKRKSK